MRRGNCEYFASAMTVMCRLLNVRARLATGFLADEFDTKGGYYIVREHDAHAWTEVFTPSSGWVTFDATSGNRWVPRREGILAGIEDFWGRVQFYWYNRVVGYNATVQRELGERVAGQVVRFARAMETSIHAAREGVINLLVRGVVDTAMVQLSILIGSVAVVVEFLLVLRWRRARSSGAQEQASGGPAVGRVDLYFPVACRPCSPRAARARRSDDPRAGGRGKRKAQPARPDAHGTDRPVLPGPLGRGPPGPARHCLRTGAGRATPATAGGESRPTRLRKSLEMGPRQAKIPDAPHPGGRECWLRMAARLEFHSG